MAKWFRHRADEAPHRATISQILVEHLTPIQARLRTAEVPVLVDRVLEREPDAEIFLDEPPPMRVLAVALHLRHAVEDLEAAHEALRVSFSQAERSYRGLGTSKARRRFLAAYLAEHATSRRALRADLGALDRELDWDAVRERHDAARHRLLAPIEMAMDFMAGAFASLDTELGTEDRDQVQEVLASAGLPGFLIERVVDEPRWPTRYAAIRALDAAARLAARRLPVDVVDRLAARAGDPEEYPWVQGVAMEILWREDPKRARELFELRLLGAGERSVRDFLARRRFVDGLVHRSESVAEDLLRAVAEHRDPSELVRMGICEAAGVVAMRKPEVFALVDELAHLGAEPSPRVRATAFRVARRVATESPGLASDAIRILARGLEDETADLASIVASGEIVALAAGVEDMDPSRLRAFLDAVLPPLVRLASRPDRSAAIQEEAAATLEALDRELAPWRRTWTRELRERIAAIGVGSVGRVPLPGGEAPPPLGLGRVLADITRRDWGLDVRVRDGELRVQRGDRFAMRLWRVLHELRALAPNKRQGFRHTVGRIYRGHLRAHPGRLDEVTATVVPGERLRSTTEGGWGRHVPLVDDVISLPILRPRETSLYSSHGVTTLSWRGSLWSRVRARLRMAWRYGRLAASRFGALQATETHARASYVRALRDEYGVEVQFRPHPLPGGAQRPVPDRIQALFPTPAPPPGSPPTAAEPSSSVPVGGLALAPLGPLTPQIQDWMRLHSHYFLSMEGTGQDALAVFLGVVSTLFLGDSYRRYRRIRRARSQVPLSIGGWGTRGKSGTERLKAGLFHGLGYQVFSKTTGCEAMFIHSVPEGPAVEVYAFRPYGKATIWEQRDILELARDLRSEVFLWECMALNWRYVRILQHVWMRDDYCTITNAYPDHEDVQGPAGMNVAQTIANFVPSRGVLINSETNFEAVMQRAADENGTRMISLDDVAGDLLAEDLLEIFPYKEHPRNIALVARLAQELEIDPLLAIVNMADNVVPDLGVLKTYPVSRVHGRRLQFINGCSANERTGYLTSWDRTGCGAVSVDDEPGEMVITVVNNREDRIPRSEVFARILTEDIDADRHVLIGTNVRGLLGYIQGALAVYLPTQELVAERDFDDDPELPFMRLARFMRRLRIPMPSWDAVERRLRIYAHGAQLELGETAELQAAWRELVEGNPSAVRFPGVLQEVTAKLAGVLAEALRSLPPDDAAEREEPEVLEPCGQPEMIRHALRQVARIVVHARLRAQLRRIVDEHDANAIGTFHGAAREVWRQMFTESLEVIHDPATKGDAIIQRAARSVPPGTHVRVMGTQNIKGTGLDFVYRWLALETVTQQLEQLARSESHVRIAALRRLQAFGDHGLMDLGLLQIRLAGHEASEPEELDALRALRDKVTALRGKKLATLSGGGGAARTGVVAAFVGWLEGWVEFIDAARRFYTARRIMDDLAHQRVSHERAAVMMRDLYARTKGGWLLESMSAKDRDDED